MKTGVCNPSCWKLFKWKDDTAENLAFHINFITEEWNLSGKIVACVRDNASNFVAAGAYFYLNTCILFKMYPMPFLLNTFSLLTL